MVWFKKTDGDYINSDSISMLFAEGSSGNYRISAPGTGNTLNCGPYSTETDAQETIRKLISGVDPSTIV